MIEMISVSSVVPAAYNPRRLSKESEAALMKSIQEIGFCVPIIVNKANNVIVAGHQRTKCAKALGLKEVPCIYVSDLVLGDEIKFNQFHNGVERTAKGVIEYHGNCPEETFTQCTISDFVWNGELDNSVQVGEICKLILKYGNVFSAVICSSEVVIGEEYVKACKLLNLPVNAYRCKNEKLALLRHYFAQDYGVYSYDGIERHTYVQGLAQMHRILHKGDKGVNTSRLYRLLVYPWLKEHGDRSTSLLDFGCGEGAHIRELALTHDDAIGVEFFNHNGSGINVSKGNRQIDRLIDFLSRSRQFDVVICDSVLNSVDSKEAELSVMACLNLFAKKDVFISGRSWDAQAKRQNGKHNRRLENYIYFCDADGFTANYRKGQWYFQKFHTKEQVAELCENTGFTIVKEHFTSDTSWQLHLEKVRELSDSEYQRAIDFEFNLPLPNGKRYGRNEDVKIALGLDG